MILAFRLYLCCCTLTQYVGLTDYELLNNLASEVLIIMPKVEVNLDQLAKALEEMSPADLETLEILLNPELSAELNDRWTNAKKELKEGNTLSKGELVEE